MEKKSVCAVVVTYHPDDGVLDNLGAIRPQVQGLVVVDNGSSEEKRNRLRLAAGEVEFTLIENGNNLGIAAALNIGVKWAQSERYRWVALFDQDSLAPPALIDTMLRAYESSPRRDRIGLLVPRYIDSRRGIPISAIYAKDGSLQVAMTSGSLMPISVFSHEGCFEDSFFIGGVDYEYCLRLRSIGYSIEECTDAVLMHAPADFTECKVNGARLFSTSNYSAGRRYYRERNTVWMIKKYWRRYPAFFAGMLSHSVKDGVKILLAETGKRRKVYYMALGVRDGLLGRMGKTVEL
ncbi:MAG TPA: glycosyltransferase family 2 protein [Acidobacteriaceae bacterium]|jgi:rhamnosyltransferase|nr:glycosyltransferase family 2 protein [Acidobacteriaceae bacterium]